MWIHSAGAQYGVDNTTIHAAAIAAAGQKYTHESESAERDNTREMASVKRGHKGSDLSGKIFTLSLHTKAKNAANLFTVLS